MKFSRWNYPLVAAIIVALVVQMTGVSAAAVGKPGDRCKTAGSKASSKIGQSLVCSKNGKKLAWKVSAVSRKIPTAVTPSASPSPSASTSQTAAPVASTTPSPTASVISGPMTADCIALLVKIGLSMDSGGGGQMPTAGGMDAIGNCRKDTGITEVITSSPFNPSEIASITKFRSCAGHDFAEGSADGQILSADPQYEKFSSMKHYIHLVKQNAGDTTEVFAPFDGVVIKVGADSGAQPSAKTYANPGRDIDFVPYANPAITFTYAHVYGISLKPGDTVTSGQKVAYHEIQSINVGHSSFDIAMSKFGMAAMRAMATKRLSMMNYLSPSVADLLAKSGLVPENSIWSAAYRAANPCVFTGNLGFFQGPENPADRVILKH